MLFLNSGAIFESAASEGAILIMPDGASVEELSNISIFRDYIRKNAEAFYNYANNARGREISNGQLHVVYGSRKSSSWGISAFSNTSADSKLHLQFLPAAEGGRYNSSITWQHRLRSGMADVKVGPDDEEHEDLPVSEDGRKLKNQCLFASTLSIRLSDSTWNKCLPRISVKIHDNLDSDNHFPSSSSHLSSPLSSTSNQVNNNASRTGSPYKTHNRVLNNNEHASEGDIIEKASPSSVNIKLFSSCRRH